MNDTYYKIKVRIRELERRIIRFFGGLSNRDFEYDFAWRQLVGARKNILDIGGCESLLPLQLAKQGHFVTVYDFRRYPEKHPNLTSIQGDFLNNNFKDNTFDYVVMVSTIEHIGFGSYGAPFYEDGDFRAISEVKRILKHTGKVILTFPFASKEKLISGFERWYDLSRVQRLVEGMYVLTEEYYIPYKLVFGRVVKWLPAALEQIIMVDDVRNVFGYQCNSCYTLSLTPRQYFS